ncbi:MAG: lipid biosynthesis B12-binding/radical SAM protein [Verrucomicrobiota bacterium]|jgi:radical SAM superfamily enzyme YgiQ (UPF0313 family)
MVSRILLINANRCSAPDPVFPLGLSHLNAALRRAGHESRLFDLLAEPQPVEEVLRRYQPDFVGISLRNIDNVLIRQQETYFADLLTLSDAVRRAHPCTVVIGGSGFSIYPRKLLELSGADFGIQGEGEASLVALVAALRGGGEYASIPGLVYRRGRQIVANPQQPSGSQTGLEAADRPPAVADFYLAASGMLNVQTQRGCEHACTYCAYPLIEGCLHRRRDPEAVAGEFEQLQAMGAKYAFVVDSVFNSSERHVVETCEAILRRGVKLGWSCFLRPQSLTLEMMRLMARAGLTHIEFGSDSFCDTVLEQYTKRLAFDDIARSSELARRAGIEHCHYLICGGPGETLATLETSFQNSRHLAGSVVLAVVGMRIFPGTPLARRAVRDGHITADADLLAPAYYFAAGLDEVTVFARLREFARRAPNWIAGDPPPGFANLVARLRRRGVVGPLWSYFAMLQRIMPQGAAEMTHAVPTA